MIKFTIIILIVVALGLPLASLAQNAARSAGDTAGAIPSAINSTSTNGGAVIAPAEAVSAGVTAPRPTPVPTSNISSNPKPTVTAPTPTATTTPSPIYAIDNPIDPQQANSWPMMLYTALTVLGAAVLAYVTSKFYKQNTKNKETEKNENQKCDSIKKMLDQKIKEMEETVKTWPEEKIKSILKEAAINKFLDKEEKALLKEAEAAKEKYEKLKETVGMLRGKYDFCMLELSSGKKLILIKAVPADTDKLIEIEKYFTGSKIYSAMAAEDEWKEEFGKGAMIYLVKKGDEILGNVSYEKRTDGSVYISGLAVIPRFQNQGIGREVLRKILEELKDANRIDLVTHPKNAAALKLYESFGFKIESRKENYYGDGEPRLILSLNNR